jgi:hypothetical protein
MSQQHRLITYNRPHASPLTSGYTFPVMPNYDLAQTWGWAPANPPSYVDSLAYANNRCYAFYLIGTGQLQPSPHQTHVTVVAPDTFLCPYRFMT